MTMKKHPVLSTLLLFLVAGAMIIYLRFFSSITFTDILEWTPASPLVAMMVILLLFAIKPFTIFLPLIVLYVTSAILFSFPIALLVNLVGLTISMTIAYFIGRFTAKDKIGDYFETYPKLQRMNQLREKNAWIFAFSLKVAGFIPNDISSLIAGAFSISYMTFLTASLAAKIPIVFVQTQLGAAALSEDAIPPSLWIITILIFGAYLLIYRRIIKKNP